MALKKKSILLSMAFLIGCFVCACGKEDSIVDESLVEDTEDVSSTEEIKSAEEEAAEQWEKGYDLPVDEQEREEAETDCKKQMELYLDIYETADKGIASNVALDDQTVLEMQRKLKDAGCPVTTMVTYSNMENYESVDSFLKECMEGKRGSVVIYEIHNDGGLGRMKFIFDGTDMYVVSTRGIWNADNKPGISYISYTRLKEWKYTEKGWFCYELCVPEPPEVSEIMDGSCLIRIKPMTEEQCEMSERCVRGLGYQGQNLLCSNWNVENMSELDYNGMFEYLYVLWSSFFVTLVAKKIVLINLCCRPCFIWGSITIITVWTNMIIINVCKFFYLLIECFLCCKLIQICAFILQGIEITLHRCIVVRISCFAHALCHIYRFAEFGKCFGRIL